MKTSCCVIGQSAQEGGALTSQVDEAAPDVGVSEQPANQRQPGCVAAQLQFYPTDVFRQQDVEGRQEIVVAAVIHKATCLGTREGEGVRPSDWPMLPTPLPGVTDLWLDVDVAW